MTTPATRQGFVAGRKYRLTEDDSAYSTFKEGDIVKLDRDDGTDIPYFKRLSDGSGGFVPLGVLEHLGAYVKVGFEETVVTSTVTTIRIDRALTPAEEEAIQKIIDQGV